MKPTALIYSSHNRCDVIHRHYIVERALEHPENKTIFFLPMSMEHQHQQQYGYDTFKWYLRRFEQYGLRHWPFFWNDFLRAEDAEMLFHSLAESQVVILGGGNSELGIWRYRTLGARFYGDPDKFERALHDRAARGLLTVGFSAGADQLSGILTAAIGEELTPELLGFGLARNVMVTLHHERGREWDLQVGARQFPWCMLFGLPNDSAIAVNQGRLPSGNWWQIVEFVIDTSWDVPNEQWHIKTRHGMKIEHYYADGRHWSFGGGDRLIRIMSPDSRWQDAWIERPGKHLLHYFTQLPTLHHSVEEILQRH